MNGVIPEGHLATTIGGDRVRLKGPATIIDPDTGEPLQGSGNAAWFKKSSAKYQISPRVGIAFPITERGVIHFSYGHFLQIPAYSYLYSNPDFEVVSGLSTIMGNANLEPQRTVGYEIGLQQQLTEDLGLNVTGFYKDVRNLLGTQIIETYAAGDRYALYTNRDYGNIRGITLTLDKRYSGLLSAKLDYTYSVSEGNASDPEATFYDTSNDIEPEKQLVALDWDQRHTVNGSVNLGVPNNWNISFIAQLGSGLPYTPEYRGTRTAFENAGRKPYQLNIDMRAHKMFAISGMRFGVYLVVYNLFDRRNEDYVYSDTGRATYSLIPMYTPESIGPNTLSEYLRRPDYYSSPREIKLGLSVGF
ncbi:MAG: TonB dependent receptor [bacterium ADurb.Bin478]|nr:MAG: TonB dependent receptor [bacterium ADurb.Bin478]